MGNSGACETPWATCPAAAAARDGEAGGCIEDPSGDSESADGWSGGGGGDGSGEGGSAMVRGWSEVTNCATKRSGRERWVWGDG